jgi:hypothetical protein
MNEAIPHSPTCLNGMHMDSLTVPWEEYLRNQYFEWYFWKTVLEKHMRRATKDAQCVA